MRIVTALTVSAVSLAGLLVGGSPAAAQSGGAQALRCESKSFCAYININYSGQILKSSAGRGSRVQVPGGTSSGSNNTANAWVGVDDITGLPDKTMFTWAPYTEANTGSAANDKINYFLVQ